MSSRAAGGFQLALGVVEHAVGVQRQDLVDVFGCGDTDRADADDLTDIASGLVVAVDQRPDQFEVGVFVHSRDRVLADVAGAPIG